MEFFKKLINKFRKDMISSLIGDICCIKINGASFIGHLIGVYITDDGSIECTIETYLHTYADCQDHYFKDNGETRHIYVNSISAVREINKKEKEILQKYAKQVRLKKRIPNVKFKNFLIKK